MPKQIGCYQIRMSFKLGKTAWYGEQERPKQCQDKSKFGEIVSTWL